MFLSLALEFLEFLATVTTESFALYFASLLVSEEKIYIVNQLEDMFWGALLKDCMQPAQNSKNKT